MNGATFINLIDLRTMRKLEIYLSCIIIVLISIQANAQTYTMSNTDITTCGGTFFDPGGTGNYSNGATQTMTIYPITSGDGICLNFTTWVLDYSVFGWSTLTFYDGTSASDPLIMEATGDWTINQSGTAFDFDGPGMVCSTGPMTLVWNPDDNDQGWEADISCYTPLPDSSGCNISALATSSTICSSESVTLTADGWILNAPLENDFNTSSIGTGWSATVDDRYDNPCGPGLDGSPHLWIGTDGAPRTLQSNSMDLTSGGIISFELRFSIQGGGAPCEGPDLEDEGVYLQYSTNTGTSWTTLHYFFPPFYTDGSNHLSSWQDYTFQIPVAAQTATTLWRWHQTDVSSSTTDHWGIDNVIIGYPTAYSFSWDNGLGAGTSQVVSPSTTTTYNVTVTDGTTSCSAPITISVSPCGVSCTLTTASSKTDINCNGNSDGTAAVNVISGATPYTYLWSNGETNSLVTGLSAGTYNVTVSEFGTTCTSTESLNIAEPVGLNINSMLCNNTSGAGSSDGTSSISASGGTTPYSYSWSPPPATGQTSSNISGLNSNLYTVIITDNNGCTITDNCSVTDPFCPASVGTINVTGVTLVGTNEYDLNSGGTVSFAATGVNENSGVLTFGYAAFSCDPQLPLSAAELLDLNANPCYLGSDYGNTTSDNNTGGVSTAPFGYDTIWIMPYTSDIADSPDNNADGCYDIGNVYQINYLPAVCGDCSAPSCPIAQVTEFNDRTDGYFGGASSNCNTLAADITNTVYTTYHTVTADGNGFLGVVQQADDGGCATKTAALRATSAGACAGSDISPSVTNANGLGSGFNPEWSGLAPNANYVVIITVTVPLGCFYGQGCSVFYWNPICSANIGTLGITGTGLTAVSSSEYDLDDGGTINFNSTGTDNDNGALTIGYAVFNCDPGLPFSAAELSDLNNNTCYLGSDYGLTTNDFNSSGGSGTLGGLDPVWIVPYTSDVADSPDNDGDGCYSIGGAIQINYLDPCAVSLVAPETDVTCFGSSDGTISANLTGGTGALNYIWSNGETTQVISGLSAGSYSVTVTDNVGCFDEINTSLTEPLELLTTLTTNDAACGSTNGTASVSETGGTPLYYYLWSNGATISTASGLNGGSIGVTVSDNNGCTALNNGFINNPIPSITVSNDIELNCNGDNSGSASVSASAGVTPYLYEWSNGNNSNSITNLTANAYNVTVTDNNGCAQTGTVNISEPALLLSSLSGNSPSCFGLSDGSLTSNIIGGTTGYVYLWSNGSSNANLTNISSGNFSLTVFDGNNCSTASTINITVASDLSLSITGTDLACFGSGNGTATPTVSGGTSPLYYLWNNGSTVSNLTNLSGGNYILTVSDFNGCSSIDQILITEPTLLATTLTSNNAACGASNGDASIIASGGTTPFSYLWNNGQTSAQIFGIGAGNLAVTITDNNGCESIKSSFINNPVPAITLTDSYSLACYNDNDGQLSVNTSGGTTPYTFNWSNGASSTTTISALDNGSYTVTVIDNIGCTQFATSFISEPLPINIASINIPVSCNGASDGEVNISASQGTSGYSFIWTNGSTSESISGLVAGTYFLTVIDANSCTSTSGGVVIEPAPLNISITEIDAVCGLSNGLIFAGVSGGSPAYNYTWDTGSTNPLLNNINAGSYQITVTDAANCNTTATAVISSSNPSLSIIASAPLSCYGDNNGSAIAEMTGGTSPYTYIWSDNQTQGLASGLSSGVYSVTASDNSGCLSISTTNVNGPALITVSISETDISCFGNSDGNLSASISGGTSGYNFLWSNGITTSTNGNLSVGNYSVTVTDNNACSQIESGILVQPSLLSITLSSSGITCNNNGSDGSITSAISGGTTGYSYNWSDSSTENDLSNLTSGIYSLTIVDQNGCIESANTTVNEPLITPVVIEDQPALCGPSAISTFSATPNGGLWSGTIVTDVNNGDVFGSVGSYQLIYTVSGYCGGADTTTFNVLALSTVLFDTTETSCIDEKDATIDAQIIGNSPFDILWSTGETTPNIDGLSAGIYTITSTGAYGCSSIDTIEILGSTIECVDIESHYYVPNIFSPNGDNENDILYVYGANIEEFNFVIYDRWGEKVFETNSLTYGWDGTYRGKLMNTDVFVYYIEVKYQSDPNNTVSEKGNITLIR